MDIEEYIQNPCGLLSVPYWKAKTLTIPNSLKIIHKSDRSEEHTSELIRATGLGSMMIFSVFSE